MSSVPAEIAGVGSTAQKLRVSPGFDPLKAQVGPDEYFVLSRIDGNQPLREVLLATGLPIARCIAIVTRLRSIGALLLPGETTAPVPATASPVKPAAPAKRADAATPIRPMPPPRGLPIPPRTMTPIAPMPQGRLPARPPPPVQIDAPTHRLPPSIIDVQIDAPTVRRASMADLELVLPNPTEAERRALAEPGELNAEDRLRILAMVRLVAGHDPWALLGVPNGADAKVLKRAYFKLSKEIHPDRFYGKQLGSFADRLPMVFEAVSRAYGRLTGNERTTGAHPKVAEQPQTPIEYATELFDRARDLEVGGSALEAMKLFAAAVRIDPQPRYLRRAASCALAAGQPKSALEYAKKAHAHAPDDPSAARLLAAAFRAAGRLGEAEEVLVMAMALKNENDTLTAELRHDLADVRRLLAG